MNVIVTLSSTQKCIFVIKTHNKAHCKHTSLFALTLVIECRKCFKCINTNVTAITQIIQSLKKILFKKHKLYCPNTHEITQKQNRGDKETLK